MRDMRDILETYGKIDYHSSGVYRLWRHNQLYSMSYSTIRIMYEDVYDMMLRHTVIIERNNAKS